MGAEGADLLQLWGAPGIEESNYIAIAIIPL